MWWLPFHLTYCSLAQKLMRYVHHRNTLSDFSVCCLLRLPLIACCLCLADDNPDWTAQDCPSPAPGASGTEAGSLLRIWCCCSLVTHGNICPHCSLAGLHMVRHRQRGTAHVEGAKDWVAGWTLQTDSPILCQWHRGRAHHQVKVHHSAVLHLQ